MRENEVRNNQKRNKGVNLLILLSNCLVFLWGRLCFLWLNIRGCVPVDHVVVVKIHIGPIRALHGLGFLGRTRHYSRFRRRLGGNLLGSGSDSLGRFGL